MDQETLTDIEAIFRTSGSPDDLFDAFGVAINNKTKDPELYKILLRNKALSTDEIAMFAEKICKEFPEFRYSIFTCVAQLFSSISFYGKHHHKALGYYKKAADSDDTNPFPYLSAAKIYNQELNVPSFEELTFFIRDGIQKSYQKSKLCFALAELYKNRGEIDNEKIYRRLGEKYQRENN